MKYIWPLINSLLILMLFMCVGIICHIDKESDDKCEELERRIEMQEKCINYLFCAQGSNDTIIVNVKSFCNK